MLRPFCVPLMLTSLLLVSCASAPTALEVVSQPDSRSALADVYDVLQSAGGRVFALESARSQVRIYAFRGGRAAAMGHNHVLTAPQFEGYFYRASSGAGKSRFDLAFRLDQLVLDDPALRTALGGGFAGVLAEDAIARTRENMLGANNFQAQQFPWMRVRSLQIVGEPPKFAAQVAVELHGQTREMWVPLTVTGLPEQLQVTGSMVLRQSEFGVQAYSVLGGLLAVEDAIVVDFTLQGSERR